MILKDLLKNLGKSDNCFDIDQCFYLKKIQLK